MTNNIQSSTKTHLNEQLTRTTNMQTMSSICSNMQTMKTRRTMQRSTMRLRNKRQWLISLRSILIRTIRRFTKHLDFTRFQRLCDTDLLMIDLICTIHLIESTYCRIYYEQELTSHQYCIQSHLLDLERTDHQPLKHINSQVLLSLIWQR